jgi:hypothetical protein
MLRDYGILNLYIMKTTAKKSTGKVGGVKVGLNGNLPVQKVPSTKGVMPGLNGKVSVQTNPGGWAGGRGNTAPKTAEPNN